MSDTFTRQEAVVAEALRDTVRGPRRNGLFAVWLVLRTAGDLLPPNRVSERGHRRRLANLELRLNSLALPPPLRRALVGATAQLRNGSPRAVCIGLQQLVAPVRETVGPLAADAVARAAQTSQEVQQDGGSGDIK